MDRQDDGTASDVVAALSAQLRRAERWLSLISQHSTDIVLLLGLDGAIKWSSRPIKLWGWIEPNAVLGATPWDLFHPDDRDRALGELATILTEGATREPVLLRLQSGPGEYRWISVIGQLLDDPELPGGIVATFRDVDTEVTALSALEQSEARFRTLAENAADVVYTLDPAGTITWVSPSVEEILGWRPEQLVGETVRTFMHADDIESNVRRLSAAIQTGTDRGQITTRFLDSSGGWRWVGLTGRVIRNADGTLQGGIESLRDVSAEVSVRQELEHLACHDPLTNLPNRSVLLDELELALVTAHAAGHSAAVVMFDLDHFKSVNDTLGHAAGDALLLGAAGRIRSLSRATDVVTRPGGDEFVVVMHDVRDPAEPLVVADRVRRAFHEPLHLPVAGGTLTVSVSAGIAISSPDTSGTELLAEADRALYAAKQGGRDRVVVADDDMPHHFATHH